MRSFIKLVLVAFLVLTLFVCARTFYFSISTQANTQVANAVLPKLNQEQLTAQFAKSLTYQTVNNGTQNMPDDQFNGLMQHFKTAYPAVFSNMTLTIIGKHALLLKWQGKNDKLLPILMMAHQDVVPIAPGTENDWQYPPFSGLVKDGYVWGRGAIDCKATLNALFASANLLLQNHFAPQRTIYFYFGDDEEGGNRTAKLGAAYFQDHHIKLDNIYDEGGVISENMVPDVSVNLGLIGVGEKGIMDLKLTAHAVGSHSSMPSSHTAIGDLSAAINTLMTHPFPAKLDGTMQDFMRNISVAMPLYKRVALTNSWLFSPLIIERFNQSPVMSSMIRTTQAPTIINAGNKSNVLPALATAIVNFRIDIHDSLASVTERVRNEINNPKIEIEMLHGSEPSRIAATNSDAYAQMAATTREIYGKDIIMTPIIMSAATDSRFFAGVANNVYKYSPLVMDNSDMTRFHGTNERYAIKHYMELVEYYYALMSQQ